MNWVLDADIEVFFDNIDHNRLIEFLERRVGDRRILRLIRKWLTADVWIKWWRKERCRGSVVVVRYADDFVIGFERQYEAEACLNELRERFGEFGLKLHEGKTRLIEFGRFAIERRAERCEGRPETFDFPGFTHRP